MQTRTVITLCAGSSGNHVLAADLGRREDVEVRLVTSAPEAWRARIACAETRILSDALPFFGPRRVDHYAGTIDSIHPWKEIGEACDGADMVVLCCPVHHHRALLERILPALASDEPTILGSLYAQGGFDWIYRDICQTLGLPLDRHTLFGLKRFPYLCKTLEYGRSVNLFGRFPKIVTAIRGGDPELRAKTRTLLGAMFRKPVAVIESFLGCTLNLSNQILHPAIGSALLRDFANDGGVFRGAVPFYGGCNPEGAGNIARLVHEITELAASLEELTETTIVGSLGADPAVRPYIPFLRRIGWRLEGAPLYASLRDRALSFLLHRNRRLEQAMLPTIPAPQGDGSVPDFNSRFWLDDIPHGLCVVYGLAALLDLAMPETRRMILEHQGYMQKRYLLEAPEDARNPFGGDLIETNAPQRYGVRDRNSLRSFLGVWPAPPPA